MLHKEVSPKQDKQAGYEKEEQSNSTVPLLCYFQNKISVVNHDAGLIIVIKKYHLKINALFSGGSL